MWYNHLLDSNTRWLSVLDPMSYHGGCEVTKGEKWVANIWINIVGDGEKDFKAWKMGNNWLAHRERNRDVLGDLEIETPRKPSMENRYTREKNIPEKSARSEDSGKTLDQESLDSPAPPSESPESDAESEAHVEVSGPEVHVNETPAPLPLTQDEMTEKPRGPEASAPPSAMLEKNRILQSVMLLIEELDQVELEILARNLHTKLKLVCVPLIMNPMGRI